MKRIFGLFVLVMIPCSFTAGNVWCAENPNLKNVKYQVLCGFVGQKGGTENMIAQAREQLSLKVTESMKSGWKLAGGVAIGPDAICQSMTR